MLAATTIARAQSGVPGRMTSADSVYARARQLVLNGNGAAGRVLVDSMIAVTPQDTPAYADALYWRASLATGGDAERDYRRIVVEYPLSPHAGDALLQLAQLEIARGDRAAAEAHLDRFLRENPASPERNRAELSFVKLAFEQNDLQRGCSVLHRTLADVPATAVETRNQLEYYLPRCVVADSIRNAPPAPATPARDTTHRDSASAPPLTHGRFTLQVAAYASRADAERLAKKLKARGLDVWIAGTAKPFRVRIGRYQTRAAAAAAAKQLKARKIDAIIADIGDAK